MRARQERWGAPLRGSPVESQRAKKALDLAPRGRVYAQIMARDGLLIGEVAARSGVSRKALRLYEATSILPAPGRTASGYRLYREDALEILAFVTQARRLGFHLDEIKEIVSIRRSGRVPCPHVLDLVDLKLREIERTLADLDRVRHGLRTLLRSRRSRRRPAGVCPHIEHLKPVKERR